MRRLLFCIGIICLSAALAGCAPQSSSSGDTNVLGVSLDAGSSAGGARGANNIDNPTPAGVQNNGTVLSGTVTGRGNYQMFELGPSSTGEQWNVVLANAALPTRSFTVALFDSDYNLLMRSGVNSTTALRHIMRQDAEHVYLGIMPAFNSTGGDFRLSVQRNTGVPVPAPRPQAVWLNFGAGDNVAVHGRAGISFESFDGSMLGNAYIGHTQEIKDTIVATMRADYAPYNVEIHTSDEGPPPPGEYSIVHFGGFDASLLGLADDVDNYNQNLTQNAIIYASTFSDFAGMGLSPTDIGLMLGNVGSHELGHLLGLYHTRNPLDVMDTTGTAWQLSDDQRFSRVDLEQTVFPVGLENSPQRLEETVGLAPKTVSAAKMSNAAKTTDAAKLAHRSFMRAWAEEEVRSGCGTCLLLDEP